MAKESKSVSVIPSDESTVIAKHEVFGWELVSSQEVLSKESHLEDRAGDLYSVTTTENYVKILFQRDTDFPNLDKIKPLEKEYWELHKRTHWKYTPSRNKLLTIVPLIICAISICGAVYGLFTKSAPNFGQRIVAFLIFAAIAAVMFGIFYAYNRFVYEPKLKKFYGGRERKDEIEKIVMDIRIQ